ncbi:MAG: hypothetical protein H7246_17370 [Phycisphaerae bacterium]|nr:hypothetical protein [Saprospiraceae bacterium]
MIIFLSLQDDDAYKKSSKLTYSTAYAGHIKTIHVNNNDVQITLVNHPQKLYLAEPQSEESTDIEDFIAFASKGDSVVKPAGSRIITVYKMDPVRSSSFEVLGKWVETWEPVM